MNTEFSENTKPQYLPQVKFRDLVFGILVKEKTRILLMFVYLFANSAVIYWLSAQVVERTASQVYTNPTVVLYFRLVVISSPLIIGLLIGAPLLSTEYESGTYRFLFTQGAGRWRMVRTLFGVYFVFILLFSIMTLTSISHFLAVQQEAGPLTIWSYAVFVSNPTIIIPLSLTAFAAGVFLGTLMRRVVPGIAVAMLFAVLLTLALQLALEKALFFFAQRLNGSPANPIDAYNNFVSSHDSRYLFQFQIVFGSLLTILSFVLALGSLRALNSGGLRHRKLRKFLGRD